MTPPGPAGIPSHPMPPPPTERSVPIQSPFPARDMGSRRGHGSDRYKQADAPRDAHGHVPQSSTDTGVQSDLDMRPSSPPPQRNAEVTGHTNLGRSLPPLMSLSVVLKSEHVASSPQKNETEKLGKKEIWEWVIPKENETEKR